MEVSASASAAAIGHAAGLQADQHHLVDAPWLASMISWAIRHIARCRSSRSITRVRARKTPP
jgi:hypothetical protein